MVIFCKICLQIVSHNCNFLPLTKKKSVGSDVILVMQKVRAKQNLLWKKITVKSHEIRSLQQDRIAWKLPRSEQRTLNCRTRFILLEKKNYITYALSRSQCRDFHVASVLLPDFDKIPKRSKLTSEKTSSLIWRCRHYW